jgi:hypothetical protein
VEDEPVDEHDRRVRQAQCRMPPSYHGAADTRTITAAKRIMERLALTVKDRLLEVGPGLGALTGETLAAAGCKSIRVLRESSNARLQG